MASYSWDAEASDLLNTRSIDYSQLPYKLDDDFKIHCVVFIHNVTGKVIAFYDGPTYILDGSPFNEKLDDYTYRLTNYTAIAYEHRQMCELADFIEEEVDEACGHNILNYDCLVLQLAADIDYTVYPDTWGGKEVHFEDTFIMSKLLDPDRFGGHSLENFGKILKYPKIEFRKDIPQEHRFKTFAADMLYYCIRDVHLNVKVRQYLRYWWEETGGDKVWEDAYGLEKAVKEIITRGEHYGFKFNQEKAWAAWHDLNGKMADIEARVEPRLPRKALSKSETPNFPQQAFKGDGEISSHGWNWLRKLGYELNEDYFNQVKVPAKPFKGDGSLSAAGLKFLEAQEIDPKDGKAYIKKLREEQSELKPLPDDLMEKALEDLHNKTMPDLTKPMKLSNQTDIKNYLLGLGWNPVNWKDKDLTLDQSKRKLSKEKFLEAVERYIESTLETNFAKHRAAHLNCKKPSEFKAVLREHDLSRPLKVLTSPSFTKNTDKEIDDNLLLLGAKVDFVEDIVHWLTYRHRRNAILSLAEWSATKKVDTGWLSNPRLEVDGRIPTPADTLGASSGRFTHKDVANIPRTTSLYGEQMRELFMVTEGCYQLGFDGDGLEARIEGHYCTRYDKQGYVDSLTAAKPNDLHTLAALKIGIPRDDAKTLKYSCLPVDNSEVLTRKGWKSYNELCVNQEVLTYNTELDKYEWAPIEKLWFFENDETVVLQNNNITLESTKDHRWYGNKRVMLGSSNNNPKRELQYKFFTTEEINTECNILNSAVLDQESDIKPHEAALVAWILSDGYYKWSEKEEITSSSNGARRGLVASIAQQPKKFATTVEDVLYRNGIDYGIYNQNDCNIYSLASKDIREFFDRVVGSRLQKHEVNWVEWILKLSKESLEEFLYHFWLADGQTKNSPLSRVIYQNKGNIAEAVMVAGNLTGHRVTVGNGSCFRINLSKRRWTTGQKLEQVNTRKTDVFCLTTKNGTFVMKQNNFITITGNCAYGAQPPKIAKQMGWKLSKAKRVFNAYWESAKPLADLKEAVTEFWKTKGEKKWIPGIDGRRISTRSQHSIINNLFQSAGVICMKRAMVMEDRWLKEEGLLGNPFKDDFTKPYTVQMIAYHDEGQNEVSKELVKLKTFKTEDDAKEWRSKYQEKTGKILSDIGHIGDKHYVGYCRVGELACKSVNEAGKYYNLKVDLTAGYQIGRNWADCH